jgi:hypothetical protein
MFPRLWMRRGHPQWPSPHNLMKPTRISCTFDVGCPRTRWVFDVLLVVEHVSYSFTTFLKPPRDLSTTAPLLNEDILLRFESFRSLVLDVCCRLLACRLRSLEPEVLLDHKVNPFCRVSRRLRHFCLTDNPRM